MTTTQCENVEWSKGRNLTEPWENARESPTETTSSGFGHRWADQSQDKENYLVWQFLESAIETSLTSSGRLFISYRDDARSLMDRQDLDRQAEMFFAEQLLLNHRANSLQHFNKAYRAIKTVQISEAADNSRSSAHQWLDRANRLAQTGYIDDALDLIYDHVDRLLSNRQIDAVASLLEVIRPAEMEIDVALALLTTTLPVRTSLTGRMQFIEELREVLDARKYDTEQLLAGLE